MVDGNNFNPQVISSWSTTSDAHKLSANKIFYSRIACSSTPKKGDSDSEQAKESTENIYCTNIMIIQ